MRSLTSVLLLAPLVGLLWSGAVVEGDAQIQVSRKVDGTLNVNIPDRYVYQKINYVVPIHGGGTMRVAEYTVIPRLKASAQATAQGIRDTRLMNNPLRMEFSVSARGDQVEVYSDVTTYRVVIYRKVVE
jgi:hypothetical protein